MMHNLFLVYFVKLYMFRQVRFPMVLLKFFIDIILPAAL